MHSMNFPFKCASKQLNASRRKLASVARFGEISSFGQKIPWANFWAKFYLLLLNFVSLFSIGRFFEHLGKFLFKPSGHAALKVLICKVL